jgi:hypothetical protein
MIILLMKNGFVNSLLEPKNIFESEYFSAVEDYSQFIHDGLVGTYGHRQIPNMANSAGTTIFHQS